MANPLLPVLFLGRVKPKTLYVQDEHSTTEHVSLLKEGQTSRSYPSQKSTSKTTKVHMFSLGAILISLRVNTGSEDSGLTVSLKLWSKDKVKAHISLKSLKIQRRGCNRKFKPPDRRVVI